MIRICLPDLAGQIDMNTVTAVDATFTGGKQADLLLSTRVRSDGNRRGREHLVYMLVEHKSYHDPLVVVLVATPLCGGRCSHMRPVQLYRYLGAIVAVAHDEFRTLYVRALVGGDAGVVFDLKGILERSMIDGRL